MIDPFGLKQEAEPEPPNEPESPVQPSASGRKRLWAVLLVLDTIFLFVFAAALAGMVYSNGSYDKFVQQWFGSEPLQPIVPKQVHAIPKEASPLTVSTATSVAPVSAPPAPPAALPVKDAPAPTAGKTKKAKEIEFVCHASHAKEVFVKGSFFVRYHGGMKKMTKVDESTWQTTDKLLPGTYRYQCVVGGKKSASKTIKVLP